MYHRSILLLSAVLLAGCANSGDNGAGGSAASSDSSNPGFNPDKAVVARPNAEELAAYAGHASYPAKEQVKTDLPVAAILSSDKKAIKIYNFSGESLRGIDVWVNGAYVQHVSGMTPGSSVVIRANELYNGLGKNFAGQAEPVSKVQLQTPNGFYNVWGPASD